MSLRIRLSGRGVRWLLLCVAILTWLGAGFASWKSLQVVPRQTILKSLTNQDKIEAWSPDLRFCAIRRHVDQSVTLWDVSSDKPLLDLRGATLHDRGMVFAPDGNSLAVAYHDGSNVWDSGIRIYDCATGRVKLTLRGHEHIFHPQYSADGKTLAAIDILTDRFVLWDATNGRQLAAHHYEQPDPRALSRDLESLMLGDRLGKGVEVFDTMKGQTRRMLSLKPDETVSDLLFSPDGHMLATSGSDGEDLWNIETGRRYRLFDGAGLRAAGFSPDGRMIVVTSFAHYSDIEWWDTSTLEKRASYRDDHRWYDSPSHSLDGTVLCLRYVRFETNVDRAWQRLISLPWAERFQPAFQGIAVFDSVSGKLIARLPGCTDAILASNGRTVVVTDLAENGDPLRIWDVPPRSAVHPMLAWLLLGLAAVLSVACWYAGRLTARVRVSVMQCDTSAATNSLPVRAS